MAVFAIVLREANDEVKQRIKEVYPDYYEFNDNFFLVQSDTIAENVAVSVGIKGEKRIEEASGVVVRWSWSYSGHTARSLWDWLEEAEKKE